MKLSINCEKLVLTIPHMSEGMRRVGEVEIIIPRTFLCRPSTAILLFLPVFMSVCYYLIVFRAVGLVGQVPVPR